MKQTIKSLAAICALFVCAINFTSCDDNHYEPKPTQKVNEMYQSTQELITEAVSYFQNALYANAILSTNDKDERQMLIYDYFGMDAETFFSDSIGKMTIYNGNTFNKMIIEHHGTLLSDEKHAEWDVTIERSNYGLLSADFISGYDPMHFTITTEADESGRFIANFHIDGSENDLGLPVFDMKWDAEFFTPVFENGTMELTAKFTPYHYDWSAFLEVTTTEPLYAIYSQTSRRFNYQSGGWAFHATNSQQREVDAEVSFFTDNGYYMFKTLYKGFSESFRQ